MTNHSDWIGRQTRSSETIADRHVAQLRATLAGTLAPDPVPPGLHWSLLPDLSEPQDLGRDGHPRKGIFLPDLGLPRRMWAGGELSFAAPLRVGDTVTRDSLFADIAFKSGSSGRLGFLTMRHLWSVDGQTRITERQDIVYREDPKAGAAAAPAAAAEDWPDATSWHITPDPVLLFRYSALTFNGHRIHYDQTYATGVEGYDGLVVHGPLQALWMLHLATTVLGGLPASFRYRGLSPLICGTAVAIEAREATVGLSLRIRRPDGVVTMQATATGQSTPL